MTVSEGGSGDEGNGGDVVGGGRDKAEVAVPPGVIADDPVSGAKIAEAAAESDVVGVAAPDRPAARIGGTLLCACDSAAV